MKKFFIAGLLLVSILFFGTSGYMLIEGASLLDGLYMTVITITTVGYGETVNLSPEGRLFTIALIFIGVSFVLYMFGKITEAVVEGGLKKIFGRLNMEKKIAKLEGHYIVCGFGRIGKVICKTFAAGKRPFVVVDNDPKEIGNLDELGYLFLEGEASDDAVLIKAGIKKAKGLIAVVSTDAENVYIILSARGLKSDLFILARSSGEKSADTKLLRAGADKVISPYYIGGTRMAQVVVRPTVIDFIDLTLHAGELGLRLEELVVSENSGFCHMSLQETGIRKDFDVIVVAIKREHGEMQFNPTPQSVIMPNDTLIVLGEHDNMKLLEKKL